MKTYTIDFMMGTKITIVAVRDSKNYKYPETESKIDQLCRELAILNIAVQRIEQGENGYMVDMEEHGFHMLTEKCASVSKKDYNHRLALLYHL